MRAVSAIAPATTETLPLDSILHGDCLELLRSLPDNSVDACVTDPPYGLSQEPNIIEVLTHWLAGDRYEHGSRGFMGKTWDSFVPGPEYWREVYRVMKPGAHLLAFGGTRTADLLSIAIRLAGFQVRDTIEHLHWIQGQGFPKSLDISKAIDKALGAEREPTYRIAIPRRNRDGTHALGGGWQDEPWETAPATDAPRQWQGYGTALKPAVEPIILARKPLSESSIAANVIRWNTGALNIDGTRIPFHSVADEQESKGKNQHGDFGSGGRNEDGSHIYGIDKAPRTNYVAQGRWPANVIISHTPFCVEGGECHPQCPAAVLDAQSGVRQAGARPSRRNISHFASGNGTNDDERIQYDTGGASRYFAQFFYSPKASRAERDLGCEHLPARSAGEATDREDDTAGLNSPRAGAGRTGGARNVHPTVKPLSLLQWLARLSCPPGGIVLDPFGGSGSTAVAAIAEGFHYIVMEREAEYVPIIEARTAHAEHECEKQHTPRLVKQPKKRKTQPATKPATTPVTTTRRKAAQGSTLYERDLWSA